MNKFPFITNVGFEIIKDKLNEPHRRWHRYDKHIAPMLKQIEQDERQLFDPVVVKLITLTHDVVYNTSLEYHSQNESASANFVGRTIYSELIGVSQKQIEAVMAGIIATRTHGLLEIQETDPLYFEDIRYFLDLDILIFSQDFEKVLEFDSLVREEFLHVPDSIFYPARREILAKFAARDEIYTSNRFRHLNDIAKNNLNKLLTVLSLHG